MKWNNFVDTAQSPHIPQVYPMKNDVLRLEMDALYFSYFIKVKANSIK